MADIDVTAYRFVGVNRQTARRLRRTLLASTTGVDDHGKSHGVPSRTAQVELLAYFRWREHEDSDV